MHPTGDDKLFVHFHLVGNILNFLHYFFLDARVIYKCVISKYVGLF